MAGYACSYSAKLDPPRPRQNIGAGYHNAHVGGKHHPAHRKMQPPLAVSTILCLENFVVAGPIRQVCPSGINFVERSLREADRDWVRHCNIIETKKT
jgi:hypothetical protein